MLKLMLNMFFRKSQDIVHKKSRYTYEKRSVSAFIIKTLFQLYGGNGFSEIAYLITNFPSFWLQFNLFHIFVIDSNFKSIKAHLYMSKFMTTRSLYLDVKETINEVKITIN